MNLIILFLLLHSCFGFNSLLFTSINKDYYHDKLNITGILPKDFNFTIYRNGFGKFEGNNFTFNHLFDSLSLILKFDINNGEIDFKARLLDSKYYNISKTSIPLYRTLGGTTPNMTKKQEIETDFHFMHDNLNANIIKIGNKLFANSDLAGDILIDSDDIFYKEKYKFKNDEFLNIITSTHPLYHPINKNLMYNYEADIINNCYKFYYINVLKEEPFTKEYFFDLYTKNFSYVHSFSLTDKYLIFIEYPMYWNIDKILTSVTILPSIKWVYNDFTKINIIDIQNNKLVKSIPYKSFFSLHHINSFVKDNNIIVDLIKYDSGDILNIFYL